VRSPSTYSRTTGYPRFSPLLLLPLSFHAVMTITLPSLQHIINSLLSQKRQLSSLVRYLREDTTAFAPKTALRVTRSGGPKALEASSSNLVSFSPHDRSGILRPSRHKSSQRCTYLVSPQSLEPTVGSPAGLKIVGPRRLTGPGTAAARESVYTVLIDRPAEGAYVCWICGEKRADRRLPRALDHVRGHFKHRPYHCSETHFDRYSGSGLRYP
jgi:hypothetical protein